MKTKGISVKTVAIVTAILSLIPVTIGISHQENFFRELVYNNYFEFISTFISAIVLYMVTTIVEQNNYKNQQKDVVQRFLQHNALSTVFVQQSYQKIDDPEKFIKTFYNELFKLDNSLKKFFHSNEAHQVATFATMLDYLITTDEDVIVDDLVALAKRHIGYGIKLEHFDTFMVALDNTLDICEVESKEYWLAMFKSYKIIIKQVYREHQNPDEKAVNQDINDI